MMTSSPVVERRHEGAEDRLLAAVADDDLVRREVEIVVAPELARDRLLERAACRPAADISCRRAAPPDRPASIAWRGDVEIRLADRQRDDVVPCARSSRARSTLARRRDRVRFSRCARRGHDAGISASALAEALDARAGLAQALGVGRVADAEMAGIA